MAIVNRTPDSFFDKGATFADDAARDAVRAARRPPAPTSSTSAASRPAPARSSTSTEEIRRTVPFVAAIREEFPDVDAQHRHLAGRGRPAVRRGGRRHHQRHLGRRRSGPGRRRGRVRLRRSCARTPAARCPAPGRTGCTTTTSCATSSTQTTRAADRLVARGVPRGGHPDRPDARLRQEHLARAGAAAPRRRARRDRLARADGAVEQGLHRRDARPAGRPAARGHARGDRDRGLARGRRSSARTTSPRPAGSWR